MAFRMSMDLKNQLCKEVVDLMAGTTGTAGTGNLKIYSGTQPATADGTSGTSALLCEISGIGWNTTTSGTAGLASTAGYSGTAATSGTAGWGRMEIAGTAGTFRVDGDIGTSGANVFTINVASLAVGGTVTLLSADVYMA